MGKGSWKKSLVLTPSRGGKKGSRRREIRGESRGARGPDEISANGQNYTKGKGKECSLLHLKERTRRAVFKNSYGGKGGSVRNFFKNTETRRNSAQDRDL